MSMRGDSSGKVLSRLAGSTAAVEMTAVRAPIPFMLNWCSSGRTSPEEAMELHYIYMLIFPVEAPGQTASLPNDRGCSL